MSDPLNHLGSIWYHSEPSDVPYSENLLRPISWFGLFLQQNDSNSKPTRLRFSAFFPHPTRLLEPTCLRNLHKISTLLVYLALLV